MPKAPVSVCAIGEEDACFAAKVEGQELLLGFGFKGVEEGISFESECDGLWVVEFAHGKEHFVAGLAADGQATGQQDQFAVGGKCLSWLVDAGVHSGEKEVSFDVFGGGVQYLFEEWDTLSWFAVLGVDLGEGKPVVSLWWFDAFDAIPDGPCAVFVAVCPE
jgi:hypothetical protein